MIICGTGHRPPKLGGYGEDVFDRLVRLCGEALDEYHPRIVISGMALGFDQALATAALSRKITLVAAVPFEGQERVWPQESQARYNALMADLSLVMIVSTGGYTPAKMQVRNEWMVAQSDLVLALWNGTPGGTANCIQYATSRGKRIVNLWGRWRKMRH